ncbi:MAG: proline--tRNA ligase, partial [Clostridia bacterium]|nr:proline--tRNA ligase [Clostridia bacterium]
EKLQENLIVRPTSETIICEMFSKWMQSYRDLPILMNQWCNVVRWEKTTRPFLRTSEFLWQEGHTVHADKEEAEKEAIEMLGVYREFAENALAIPVFTGRKSEKEKFAGAVATYGMEAMMLDGKSLQAGTSHYLGQNFAKAFDMKFLDKDGVLKYGYSTSWGVSTRLIGALIMAHGDQRGLVLPPVVAPIQVIVIPIAAHKGGVNEKAEELVGALTAAGIRAEIDSREESAGWKFNEWEMKGVPLRIEVGPRDIENGQMFVCRRDTHEKTALPLGDAAGVCSLLDEIQKNMLEKSRKLRDEKVRWADNLEEIVSGVDGGFVKAPWCGCRECEDKVKEVASATSRVMTDDDFSGKKCAICGKDAKTVVFFAKAY